MFEQPVSPSKAPIQITPTLSKPYTIPSNKPEEVATIPSQIIGTTMFVSDLEGCIEQVSVKYKQEGEPEYNSTNEYQNIGLCTQRFFDSIKQFLDQTPEKNRVVFLGDYFDKGPHVMESINGIAGLISSHKSQTTVVLGNRDINKFRFAFEIKDALPATAFKGIWSVWKTFPENYLKQTTPYGRLEVVATAGMGAGECVKGASDAIKQNWLRKELEIEEIEEIEEKPVKGGATYPIDEQTRAIALFMMGLEDMIEDETGELQTFLRSLDTVYANAVICDIIEHSDNNKTFVSHAGGFHDCVLWVNSDLINALNDNLIKNEISKEPTQTDIMNYYFGIMEYFRENLEPNNIEPEYKKVVALNTFVEIQNELFKSFYTQFSEQRKPKSFDKDTLLKFMLLQAMGLKPNGPAHEFASVIQSCGTGGCNGIVGSGSSKNVMKAFKEYGIQTVAHGHVPHCAPLPLIYKRKVDELGELVYVANDTSNGQRPSINASEDFKQVPLSFLKTAEGTPNTYVIGFLTEDGTVSTTVPETSTVNVKERHQRDFSRLIAEYSVDDLPSIEENVQEIVYNGKGTVVFNGAKSLFAAATFEPMTSVQGEVLETLGGKRRKTRKTRNRKRTTIRLNRRRKGNKSRRQKRT